MLIYQVTSLPDISLTKYQAFEDSGISGMLSAQTQFLRQVYRVSLICGTVIHVLYEYDPERAEGSRLGAYVLFTHSGDRDTGYDKVEKFVRSSSLFSYYNLQPVQDDALPNAKYRHCCSLSKRERIMQTVVDSKESYFYLVPNWEMCEEARLYRLFKLMESFGTHCAYRVDISADKTLADRIHESFERPLSFLRNIDRREKGLSSQANAYQAPRDPNADTVLREYEAWLRNVDGSAPFRSMILAFSDDPDYAQLLLDAALVEAVSKGNATIHVHTGDFNALSWVHDRIADECEKETPRSMRSWSTTMLVEEAAAFMRLPVLYDGEHIELPKETDYQVDGAEKGCIVLGKDSVGHDALMPFELLPKHMFIAGVPGSGKTNTMLLLADSLWNTEVPDDRGGVEKSHIPFLALEPAKHEYRELANFDIPELLIFSPASVTNFPLRLNPFEFPKGLTLSEHIGKLCEVFEGSFPIAPPAPFILDRAIQAIYEHHDWNVHDVNTGSKPYPTMTELYEQFERELENTNYDSEIRGNIRSVLEMRIGSLLRREKKAMFDVERSSLAPEEWLEHPIIIELESLGEGPANFVTLLLCTLIREVLKVSSGQSSNRAVRHVIFLEEAHNLIAPQTQSSDSMDSNPKIAATKYIVKMLAEVRALHEGIIIADQLPTAMAPEVIKNTNVKIIHRLTSTDDRQLVADTMSASAYQVERMATFIPGEALCFFEKLQRPFEMSVSEVEQHSSDNTDDDRLYALMSEKPGFQRQMHADEEFEWGKIRLRAANVVKQEKQAIASLSKLDASQMRYADLERYVETCARIQTGLERMRSRLLYDCQAIERRYGSNGSHHDLQAAIAEIGQRHRACIEKLIALY